MEHCYLHGSVSCPWWHLLESQEGSNSILTVALDCETNGQDPRDPFSSYQLLGVSYADSDGASGYLSIGHLAGNTHSTVSAVSFLRGRYLDSDSTTFVFHNAKFDLRCIHRGLGLDLYKTNWYDTMLMQHFIDENMFNKSLDALAYKYFRERKAVSDVLSHFINGPGWPFIPVSVMEPYAIKDAELTLRIFQRIYPDFKEQGFDD